MAWAQMCVCSEVIYYRFQWGFVYKTIQYPCSSAIVVSTFHFRGGGGDSIKMENGTLLLGYKMIRYFVTFGLESACFRMFTMNFLFEWLQHVWLFCPHRLFSSLFSLSPSRLLLFSTAIHVNKVWLFSEHSKWLFWFT